MPAEEDSADGRPGTAGKSDQNQLLSSLMPVLTVIGTGIGVLGFVIFFGGFIAWTRFDAAGLPANEAVAQIPRNDLIVTGASFLVPALLAALAAVAVALAAWNGFIGNRLRRRKARAKESRIRTDARVEMLRAEEARAEGEVAKLQSQMDKFQAASSDAQIDSDSHKAALNNYRAAKAKLQEPEKRLAHLRETELPAARADQADVAKMAPEAEKLSRNEWLLQAATGVGPMLIVEVLVIAAGWGGLSWNYRALLIGVMLATIAVAIIVISMTEHFALFALSVFLGVGVMIAFSTYARTQSHTKVSPLAAIDGSAPIAGFFVAETSDAVYIGVPEPEPPTSRADRDLEFDHNAVTLLRLPKASLTNLTIGPGMDEGEAYMRSLALALALCRHRRQSLPERTLASASLDQKDPSTKIERQPPCAAAAARNLSHRLASVKGFH